jgi:hypothetical protein
MQRAGSLIAMAGPSSLGPENGSLQVRTYRDGLAAKAGHDLVLEVGSWEATVRNAPGKLAIELRADPTSLRVVKAEGGVKPITDRDRDEIRRTVEDKVLRAQPIGFHGTAVGTGDQLTDEGELTLAGETRPVSARLELGVDGRLTGTIPLVQSQWGIKPYRGLLGALKVRDEIEVLVDVRLPAS